MQIEIKIDENCKEPKIIVVADKITKEISEIIKKLSEEQTKTIAGFKETIVMFPIAYVANWMGHSIEGILGYVGIFIGIFAVTWLTQYLAWRGKIKKMNGCIKNSENAK